MNRRSLYTFVCMFMFFLVQNTFCAADSVDSNVLLGQREFLSGQKGFKELLSRAVYSGDVQKVRYALENASAVEKDAVQRENNYFLYSAVVKDYQDIVSFLLDYKANIELGERSDSGAPLQYACLANNLPMVQLLVQKKACIEACPEADKLRPLHCAARGNYVDVMDCLLKAKADVNALDVENKPPLHYALKEGHKEAFFLLLTYKADIHRVRSEEGHTILYEAAKDGRDSLVARLLTGNVQDSDRKNTFNMVRDNASFGIGVEKARTLMSLLAVRACSNDACETLKYGDTYKLCGGCKKAYYCGQRCQSADWSEHKIRCERLKQLQQEQKEREEARMREELQSEQNSKINSRRVAEAKREQDSNTLKEAIRSGNKLEVERLVGLGFEIYPETTKWTKKLNAVRFPERAEVGKKVHRRPEVVTAKKLVATGLAKKEKAHHAKIKNEEPKKLGKAERKLAIAAVGCDNGDNTGFERKHTLDRNYLPKMQPLSAADKALQSSDRGAGPVELELQARDGDRKVNGSGVFRVVPDAECKESAADKQLGVVVMLSHPQYGEILLDLDHICVGHDGYDGMDSGLHLDNGKDMESRGLLERVSSYFDYARNGCYKAKRVGAEDSDSRSFFPAEWDRHELQDRLMTALCENGRSPLIIYENKRGDTCIVGSMRDTIYFKAIIKKHQPGVIRTAYPITHNKYTLECLKHAA